MRRPLFSRRSLLRQFAFLGVGLGAAWWLRQHYLFPEPTVDFGGGASTGWLPLPDPSGLIELGVHVKGIPLRVVVDSGAQFSAIDGRLAQRLGLQPTPLPMLAFGVSGEPSVTHMVSLDLALGPLQVLGLHAATLDLVGLSGMMRRPFAMLLGRDFLSVVAADIDWPNGRAAFLRPEALKPAPSAKLVPSRSQGRALMVEVAIEASAPIELMVDTGATSEIALSAETARKLSLADRPAEVGRSVSLGGFAQDRVVRASSVQFAGRRLQDVEVQIFTPTAPAPLPAGLLGVGILKHYRVGLDLGAGLLWLDGPQPARRRPGEIPRAVLDGG